jgi:hypothetical protein
VSRFERELVANGIHPVVHWLEPFEKERISIADLQDALIGEFHRKSAQLELAHRMDLKRRLEAVEVVDEGREFDRRAHHDLLLSKFGLPEMPAEPDDPLEVDGLQDRGELET